MGIDPESGKPICVRIGRHGAFIQVGTAEDKDKPKFVGLLPGQSMHTITEAEVMQMISLPRKLGMIDNKIPVSANIGRYGPYIKYGNDFVSLGKDDDLFTITLERAKELVRIKEEVQSKRVIKEFEQEGIQVLNGRYGPYISNGEKNARIPKDLEPAALTLEQCQSLLETAKHSRFRKKKTANKGGLHHLA